MEPAWKYVLVNGFLPQWADSTLQRLLTALENNDRRLVQGKTTIPVAHSDGDDFPTVACCPVSFCAVAEPFSTPAVEVDEMFGLACAEADRLLGTPLAVRFFLNWVDDGDRDRCFELMAEAVREELQKRATAEVVK